MKLILRSLNYISNFSVMKPGIVVTDDGNSFELPIVIEIDQQDQSLNLDKLYKDFIYKNYDIEIPDSQFKQLKTEIDMFTGNIIITYISYLTFEQVINSTSPDNLQLLHLDRTQHGKLTADWEEKKKDDDLIDIDRTDDMIDFIFKYKDIIESGNEYFAKLYLHKYPIILNVLPTKIQLTKIRDFLAILNLDFKTFSSVKVLRHNNKLYTPTGEFSEHKTRPAELYIKEFIPGNLI